MKMNTIKPPGGSKRERTRVGRGIGSGLGKTCGRGHKGQHSRSGGYHKVGFEGGQLPLQRRLPKVGFRSRMAHKSAQVFLYQIENLGVDSVDATVLRQAGLVDAGVTKIKLVNKGNLSRAVKCSGVLATAGAKAAIEAAGGSVE